MEEWSGQGWKSDKGKGGRGERARVVGARVEERKGQGEKSGKGEGGKGKSGGAGRVAPLCWWQKRAPPREASP